MARKAYPEFHKMLLDPATHPDAKRRVKWVETRYALLYRTGTHLYKVRKSSTVYSSLAIKERFALEGVRLEGHWGLGLEATLVPIVRVEPAASNGHTCALGGEGVVLDYALRMVQLSDAYWLHTIAAKGRLTPPVIGRLARYLAERHATSPAPANMPEASRLSHFEDLLEDQIYQSKKYRHLGLNEAMLELIVRPLHRFNEGARKVFARRLRKGRIVDGHGAFVPEHIHVKGQEIQAISPLDGQPKYRVLDAANDVAALLNGWALEGQTDAAELFVRRYASAAKDRELAQILPAYQTLQALRAGVQLGEQFAELGEGDDAAHDALHQEAHAFFNLAVKSARLLAA